MKFFRFIKRKDKSDLFDQEAEIKKIFLPEKEKEGYLSLEKGFWKVYGFLSRYYFRETLPHSDLGAILGSMSPIYDPIDSWFMDTWLEINQNKQYLTENECFTSMVAFVKEIEIDFVYDFKILHQYLKNFNNPLLLEDWAVAFEWAIQISYSPWVETRELIKELEPLYKIS